MNGLPADFSACLAYEHVHMFANFIFYAPQMYLIDGISFHVMHFFPGRRYVEAVGSYRAFPVLFPITGIIFVWRGGVLYDGNG